MKAIRVFNNNAVSAVMLDGRVAIVLGKGIGFHKRPGDPVEERCIEKVYYVQDEMQTKFLQMLQNVEPSVMRAAEQILAMAENVGFSMSNQATISLIDHTLACDRQANDLGKFYDPHHPALLRAIKMAADAAHKAGIWIGICGELGADISMLPTFLAMGIDELSVSPAAVLPLRAAIRQSIAQTCTLEKLEC